MFQMTKISSLELTDINSHLVKAPLGGSQPISTSVLVTALQIELSTNIREVDTSTC